MIYPILLQFIVIYVTVNLDHVLEYVLKHKRKAYKNNIQKKTMKKIVFTVQNGRKTQSKYMKFKSCNMLYLYFYKCFQYFSAQRDQQPLEKYKKEHIKKCKQSIRKV